MTRDDPIWREISALNGQQSATARDVGILRPQVEELSTDMATALRELALMRAEMESTAEETAGIAQTVQAIQDQMERFTRYMERTIWDIGKQLGPDVLLAFAVMSAIFAVANPEAIKSVPPISNIEEYLSGD